MASKCKKLSSGFRICRFYDKGNERHGIRASKPSDGMFHADEKFEVLFRYKGEADWWFKELRSADDLDTLLRVASDNYHALLRSNE